MALSNALNNAGVYSEFFTRSRSALSTLEPTITGVYVSCLTEKCVDEVVSHGTYFWYRSPRL